LQADLFGRAAKFHATVGTAMRAHQSRGHQLLDDFGQVRPRQAGLLGNFPDGTTLAARLVREKQGGTKGHLRGVREEHGLPPASQARVSTASHQAKYELFISYSSFLRLSSVFFGRE
jgi:hypothetical protein